MKKSLFILVTAFTINANAQISSWQWAKSAGGTSNDIGNSISVDASGNSYVTGMFQSTSITFGSTTLN